MVTPSGHGISHLSLVRRLSQEHITALRVPQFQVLLRSMEGQPGTGVLFRIASCVQVAFGAWTALG